MQTVTFSHCYQSVATQLVFRDVAFGHGHVAKSLADLPNPTLSEGDPQITRPNFLFCATAQRFQVNSGLQYLCHTNGVQHCFGIRSQPDLKELNKAIVRARGSNLPRPLCL